MSWRRWPGLLGLLAAVCMPAWADPARFELSAFGGYRAGGQLEARDSSEATPGDIDFDDGEAWGIGIGLYRDSRSYYELLYSRQNTESDFGTSSARGPDITTEYYQVGGTLIFPGQSWFWPYVSVTLGLTRFKADGFDTEDDFSGSFGIGGRIPLGDHVAFTLGLRGYMTLVDSNTGFFCASSGGQAGCLIQTSGDAFFQGEATAGIAVRF